MPYADLREFVRRLEDEKELVRIHEEVDAHLEIAEITDPSVHFGSTQIFLGATVTYVDESGLERTITIMGIDEANSAQGQVSWVSPIARALLKAREGDVVRLITPTGAQDVEVLAVDYRRPGEN